MDVEYVRNLIVSMEQTNDLAANLFETAKRSYERSPRLANQSFSGYRLLRKGNAETAAVPFDRERFDLVMRSIASALYLRDNARRYDAQWIVFSPHLHSPEVLFDGKPDRWTKIRTLLASAQFTSFECPEPRVFQYAVHMMTPKGFIYRFDFYEGFEVNVWTLLPDIPA